MVSSGLTENQLQLSVEVSPSFSDLPRLGEKESKEVDNIRIDWGE